MTRRDPQTSPGAPEDRAAEALVGPVSGPDLHVMSWNLRRPVPAVLARTADRWEVRAPRVRALLSTEQPTVLGAQEVVAGQAEAIRAALGARYRHVGRGRAPDGGGEATPVFYDADRLELLDWDQSALSDRPSRPGSASWGNVFPRIVVSAAFRDRATGGRFLAVNTHLDPLSPRSRVRSAQAILAGVAARGLPVVLTGDLNAGPSSAAVRALLADGTLTDSWSGARIRLTAEWGTYARYRAPRGGGARIDWILSSSAFSVSRAAINPRRHGGGWPSDHLPVHAVMRLDEGGATT
ncbi:endonuclease/exonuclease/phosphatase family protein [Dietzia sp. UBA5065]|uniref:endonuclease/exonuclease/phosphatase family protein n=1 Tax=Dietzia sp. UBA5065 TaxID=1946422 RepID=UPI0025C2EB5E|nr:endonuclease/exonuclease/phosphatase family protein [Dietzia sp. UBA5065]HMT51115.1 endonuclease/exonuclease/phosphatase family protein [Dietzia sp.]